MYGGYETHKSGIEVNTIVGKGSTVIVKVESAPIQPLIVGVTVIVATTGLVPTLVAVNAGILPFPFVPNPIVASELVQAKVVPGVVLVNGIVATAVPLHISISVRGSTVGVGFTVMVYVEAIPTQLFAVGVTVMVAEIGAVVVLVAVKAAILPSPFEGNPIAVLELVHANDASAVELVKFVAGITSLLQTSIFLL